MQTKWMPWFLRTAFIGALAAVVLLGTETRGFAADDDDDDALPDQKVMRSVLKGLGLRRPGDEPDIDYRERSPLVVPPNRDLPPPEAAPAVEKNAAWPDDPDVRARREARQERKQRKPIDWEADSRQLSRAELDKKVGDSSAPAPQGQQKSVEESSKQSTPSELGYFGGLFTMGNLIGGNNKEEYVKFEKEPARTDLTMPPPGYLTPSPNQPYGVSKSTEKVEYKPVDQAVGSAADR